MYWRLVNGLTQTIQSKANPNQSKNRTEQKAMSTIYAPVFVKNDHKFIIPYEGFSTEEDESTAKEIGWGTTLVEGVIYGFKFAGEVITITNEQIPNIPGNLGPMDVYIIAGPAFDEVRAKAEAESEDQ